MRYFSRIRLDTRHPGAAEALQEIRGGNVYRDHQWLWRFFPADPSASRDFIFRRMDPQGAHEHPMYYIVSKHSPVTPHPAWMIDSREYTPQVANGDRFAFDLRVNPVVTRDNRRHDVVMDAKTAMARHAGHESWTELPSSHRPEPARQGYAFIQNQVAAWLDGAQGRGGFASRHGFELAPCGSGDPPMLRADAYRRHRLSDKDRAGKPAWFTSVDLCGELVIADSETFHRALFDGVGHAKAFGCGLLLIRRI